MWQTDINGSARWAIFDRQSPHNCRRSPYLLQCESTQRIRQQTKTQFSDPLFLGHQLAGSCAVFRDFRNCNASETHTVTVLAHNQCQHCKCRYISEANWHIFNITVLLDLCRRCASPFLCLFPCSVFGTLNFVAAENTAPHFHWFTIWTTKIQLINEGKSKFLGGKENRLSLARCQSLIRVNHRKRQQHTSTLYDHTRLYDY